MRYLGLIFILEFLKELLKKFKDFGNHKYFKKTNVKLMQLLKYRNAQ